MKNLVFIFCALLLIGCKQEQGTDTSAEAEHVQRYFAESDETKIALAAIENYEKADWEAWKGHFADTAKIFVNSNDHVSVADRAAEFAETTSAWSNYGFDKEKLYSEMVLDKEDETWVYVWGTHNGTFAPTGKELSIPVHIAFQFVDGKIVEEHVFFDGTALNAEAAKAAAMAEGDSN